MFDPGAVLTLLRQGFLSAPKPSLPPVPLNVHGAFVDPSAHTGGSTLFGPRTVAVSLGGPPVVAHVFEAETHDECLLGADFVAAHVKHFDVDKNLLTLSDGQHVTMTRSTAPVPTAGINVRVVAAKSVTVPPGEVVYVAVSAKGCDVIGSDVAKAPPSSRSQGPGPGEDDPRDTLARTLPLTLVGQAVGDGLVPPHRGFRRAGLDTGLPPAPDDQLAGVRNVRGPALPRGLEVKSSLMAAGNGTMAVAVYNPGIRPRTLLPGRCVLLVNAETPVSINSVDTAPQKPGGLLAPLEDLLARCSANLAAPQCAQVRELMSEFQSIFSCSGEIGHCKLVEHHIDTGDAAPIKEAPSADPQTEGSRQKHRGDAQPRRYPALRLSMGLPCSAAHQGGRLYSVCHRLP